MLVYQLVEGGTARSGHKGLTSLNLLHQLLALMVYCVHSPLSHLDDIVEAYFLDRTVDLLTGCLKLT